jgi:hypothetical protein
VAVNSSGNPFASESWFFHHTTVSSLLLINVLVLLIIASAVELMKCARHKIIAFFLPTLLHCTFILHVAPISRN